ncbi:MAG: FAD-dependent monooxygenase [Castellaniella sp.]
MQFHHQGYVSADPRIQPAAGIGLNRPAELPDHVDVLIVGAGPAGVVAAAQLAQFPEITTRLVDRRASRLEVGQADGIQPRSVETFEAFGFADRIVAEGCRVVETAFWKPDPKDPARIARTSRVLEDPNHVSEYPHITVNQARVLDYFSEAMAFAPTRMQTDWGYEFQSLERTETGSHPLKVTLLKKSADAPDETRIVHARFVVGADGAHSRVRAAIGCTPAGDSSNHAWGVMDLLAVTDFPDIRIKCAIQSDQEGSILLIPREGGHLFRLYVDLGEVDPADRGAVRKTSVDQVIARARKILHPYNLDVRDVAWFSVYEVGHRVCDRFDDVPPAEIGTRTPRVFIVGDASHTHSAKAGQGMNVSMQDGFNLGWKLAHVLLGRSPASLLHTYSGERQVVGEDIIRFDKRWASILAKRPEDFSSPQALEDAYLQITEFAQGFMTCYPPSMIAGEGEYAGLASGYPIGRRFRSAMVARVADGVALHMGHEARADGRWRLYVFADRAAAGQSEAMRTLADWLQHAAESPLRGYTPGGLDANAWFDLSVIYQQLHTEIDINQVPAVFKPAVGQFGLTDYERVYSVLPGDDIFAQRQIDRDGAMVLVRPDQYVAHVLPLSATIRLGKFIGGFTSRQS